MAMPMPLPALPIEPVSFQQERQVMNPQQQQQRSAQLREKRSRRDFLMFIKVLLKCIEQSKDHYKLSIQAKALVAECIKRNRMGDPHFSPLQENVELRLRGLVGPVMFNKAMDMMDRFQATKLQRGVQQMRQMQRQLQMAQPPAATATAGSGSSGY